MGADRNKARQRWIGLGVCLALLAVGWLLRPNKAPELLAAQFVGYTNAPGAGEFNRVAMFALSNRCSRGLVLSAQLAIKSEQGWRDEVLVSPNYLQQWDPANPLPSGEARMFSVYVLHPGKEWRLRIGSGIANTSTWEQRRLRWALWLESHRLGWVAGRIAPKMVEQEVLFSGQFPAE